MAGAKLPNSHLIIQWNQNIHQFQLKSLKLIEIFDWIADHFVNNIKNLIFFINWFKFHQLIEKKMIFEWVGAYKVRNEIQEF